MTIILTPKKQVGRQRPGHTTDLVAGGWIIIKAGHVSIIVLSLAPSFSNTLNCLVDDEDS